VVVNMKIGIIGAMSVEVEGLKASMSQLQIEKISTVDYYIGKINGVDTVVATAGVGKVNAAVSAQTMILKYNPDIIINIGVAGGLSPELSVCDIAIATDVVEHDMDTTPIGDEAGFISGINKVYMECDKKITDLMYECAKELEGINVIKGTIASGDQFIASDEQRGRIMNLFPTSVAAEMEGASIGHVCTMANKPFAVLRAISDGANSDSVMDFPTFTKKAAKNSVEIIKRLLDRLV